jgi:hypothetical protein
MTIMLLYLQPKLLTTIRETLKMKSSIGVPYLYNICLVRGIHGLGLGFLFHHLFYFTKYNTSNIKTNLFSVHTLLFAVFL